MKSLEMAFLHSTAGMSGGDQELCETLWKKTAELLVPNLGKHYRRFEPAAKAWDNEINKPYGVILGRSDPKSFLFFYVTAREAQEKAVDFHLNSFLGGFDLGERFDEDGLHGFTMNPKEGAETAVQVHLLWHLKMMGGGFFPDAGIYYVPAKQAVITEALNDQILSDVGHYAISVVRFYAGDSDDRV